MKVTSINDHIKIEPSVIFVRAAARQGWFVITLEVNGEHHEIFYNQDGREVFRADCRCFRCWYKSIVEFVTTRNATVRLILKSRSGPTKNTKFPIGS
jgi:hypothetical protein